jgi:arsenate reductase (glutaredoxin)
VPYETVDLFKTPLTAATVRDLCRKLGVGPREILRTKDPAYEEHGLASGRHSDAELFELMAANPGLIQRPIVVKGDRAVVARPVENAEKLLR